MGDGKWTVLEEQVADAIIRKRSRKKRCGRWMLEKCCDCCFKRSKLKKNYNIVILMGFIFLVLFVAFLIWLVIPFLKTLSFEPGQCSTNRIKHVSRNSCSCGKGCHGYFPCLVVDVDFENSGSRARGMLYDVEFGGKCSFTPPCSRYEDTNRQRVWAFRDEVEHGTFPCLYGAKTDYIMRAPRLGIHSAVHLLLWPALGSVVCFVMLIVMCMTCGCKFVCDSKAPPDVIAKAEGLMEMGLNDLENMPQAERELVLLRTNPR